MSVKSRCWVMLLYPDCLEHQAVLDVVFEKFNCIGVLHDRDVLETGELKKAHYHILFYFPSAVYSSHILSDLPQLEDRFLQPKSDIRIQTRYLLHLDSPSKYLYSKSDLLGHVDKFQKYLDKEQDENEKVLRILDVIENTYATTLTGLLKDICSNNLYSVYRRNSYTFNKIFYENLELRGFKHE